MPDEEKHFCGECPTCQWRTRELWGVEVESCKDGRMRCSGSCATKAIPNQPGTFSPRLKLVEMEAK